MIVSRWQAQIIPNKTQIKLMFEAEGLTPFTETLNAHIKIPDHRHAFDEVRMVVEGELLLNVAGNKLLLRAGDKIIIPSNTKHSKEVNTDENCICICANRTF
ncbi:MAG: cupin domain-containing protein [Bdellovibrionaceae bacterium]|nr:cupin domain-containing protein [Pseudobdellovibrionaceae bacterium]